VRRLLGTAVVAGVLVLAAGCGDAKAGYGNATRTVFMKSCDPANEGGNRAMICRCAYDQIEQRYSYEEYSSIDAALQTDPEKVPSDINAIIGGCAFSVELGGKAPGSSSSGSSSSSSTSESSRSSSSTSSSA
jgi:hypothetical protein